VHLPSCKTIRDETTNNRLLAPGSSGALVVLDHYVCGFIIASRQDVPWAYMALIHPILNDIRMVLKARDVDFPSAAEINWAHIGEAASSSVSRRDVNQPFALGDPDLENGIDDPPASKLSLMAHSAQHDLDSRPQESERVYPSVPVVSPGQLKLSNIWHVGDLFTDFLAWIFLVCFDFICRVFRRT
jgi:hypothetical protein